MNSEASITEEDARVTSRDGRIKKREDRFHKRDGRISPVEVRIHKRRPRTRITRKRVDIDRPWAARSVRGASPRECRLQRERCKAEGGSTLPEVEHRSLVIPGRACSNPAVPIEIERKFLVRNDAWKHGVKPVRITQGYLSRVNERVVRVRLSGGKGWLTVKGKARGPLRREYEYEIPSSHAAEMLDQLCERPLLDKLRYRIPQGDVTWEVDEFLGDNAGLVVAEVELTRGGHLISLPDWVGEEVTNDPRYHNNQLAAHPYSTWK